MFSSVYIVDLKNILMRILAVDDQPLVLKSIENKLSKAGYEVILAHNGLEAIEQYDKTSPDLVILDLEMPLSSGMDVIQSIRKNPNDQTPIIVMSGNEEEEAIVKTFQHGVNDYIQKPVGLNELLARVKRHLNQDVSDKSFQTNNKKEKVQIQKNIIGVVIPCYNEELRLRTEDFLSFIDSNLGYHLCFVNDGSTDNTLGVLNDLAKGRESNISVFNCELNGGKAEAVRQGMLHLLKDPQLDYIGFLDADLSTDFKDFDDLVHTISTSEFKIVSGSRIARMGADIHKEGARAIISKTINKIIQNILGMPFRDTQCGAKIMTRDVIGKVFKKRFHTRWLFDVEIFLRMKKEYGSDKAISFLCEQPLKRWVHEDGSKLSMKDSFKILGQLFQLAVQYR